VPMPDNGVSLGLAVMMEPRIRTSVDAPTEKTSDERLDDLLAVTDTGLRQLDLQSLLVELLDRVREIAGADTATVLLLDPSSQTLVATAARGLEEEVYQGVRLPVGRGFAGRIAATRRPAILNRVDESTVAKPIPWENRIQTLMGVPLLGGHGRLVGVLHVSRLEPRAFSDDDVSLLEVVADRVGAAVEASRLMAETRAATILERSLMPTVLPEVPGAGLAARHVTAGRAVGGDWYDAFVLPTGELWMVAGDVAGHGLHAAVVMGRIRSSLRAYALLGESPARTLELTDKKVQHFEVGAMVTVVCAVARAPYEEFHISSAGHLPPLVASTGAEPSYVELDPDPPLGVKRDWRWSGTTVGVSPGGVLVLYTDGLVERHDESVDRGLERLRRAVVVDDPDIVCQSVMRRTIGPGAPLDDIAVLAFRRTVTRSASRREPSQTTLESRRRSRRRRTAHAFPLDPQRILLARRFAVDAVRDWPVDPLSVALVVTELASNAVQHAGTSYTVQVEWDPSVVRIEVTDEGEGMPTCTVPAPGTGHGRGLVLVDTLAREWGVRRETTGKTVWVDLPTTAEQRPTHTGASRWRVSSIEVDALDERGATVTPDQGRRKW